MNPTLLKYLENSYLFESEAKVLGVSTNETGKIVVILDQTIFYPQGGGQPYDKGEINTATAKFNVEEVRFEEGIVKHIGNYITGSFVGGDSVKLIVDSSVRMLNCRNHTAGHIIDLAVKNIGEKLTPIKGFHFPHGAYVEYQGLINEENKGEIKQKLEKEVNKIIEDSLPIETRLVSKEELSQLCSYVPDWIPADKPTRIVKVGEYSAHPCGGTHVKNTKEVGPIVLELKNKSGNTRINYQIT